MLGTAVITWAYNLGGKGYEIRAIAYFAMYILAVNVSGGHFNPATSLAVYLTEAESKSRNTRYLIAVIIF
jgi:glycerol uptake facilitator-like aquaporin